MMFPNCGFYSVLERNALSLVLNGRSRSTGANIPLAILAIGLALAILPLRSARANLIQNPGFETGTFTPWTTTGNLAVAQLPYFNEGSTAVDGTAFATFNAGDSTPNGVLSQSFATVIGTRYMVNYLYGSNGGQRQSVTASIKDTRGTSLASQFATLPTVSNSLAPFTFAFTADTTSSTLAFTDFASNPTTSTDGFVDNVVVAPVAEPSSLILLATAACCFTALRWWPLQNRPRSAA